MKYLLLVFSVLFLMNASRAQYRFIIPSHYHGLFNDQLSSAKAQGMGYTTITTDGIATSIYNPATISPGNTVLDVAVNYAKGHPYFPQSYYPFVGLSYRVLPKLVVGGSMFAWIDPDSYWTATIGGQEFDTDKKTQHMYSLTAAYEIIKGLHFGASGNFIREKAVKGTTTIKEFIASAGVIYDRDVNFIKSDMFTNEKIRVAASLVNLLMNAKSEQRYQNILNYRDMPIILRGGAGYGFSIPVKAAFAKKYTFFDDAPELVDIFVRLQYQNFLHHKDHIYTDDEYSTAFGIGAEAWFMKLVALRIGYYTENREDKSSNPGDIVVTTDNKSGFTWGFGANIPVQRLTKGKVPVDVEANFVTSKMMNEVDERYNLPADFKDRRFQFCAGLNIRWNGKKK